MDGSGQIIDSDGNHVNVGNFDVKGLNVNNNWDNKRNDDLGLASARQSSLYPAEVPRFAGLRLSLLRRANPPAKHATNLIDVRFKRDVFLVIDGLHVFGQANENAQDVELHTSRFKYRQFLRFARLACEKNRLEHVEDSILRALPYRIAILLRNVGAIAVEGLIEVITFLKNRYVQIIVHIKVYKNLYNRIISTENLFEAWNIFKRDKRNRQDVEAFEKNVEYEIFKLGRELSAKYYRHGPYRMFLIHDPKLRCIHKATVRDRVLHHAIFKVLNPIFEPTFIPASFSCRVGKGTHKGVEYLKRTLRTVSKNGMQPCYALKCDVRKFFDSIDHDILFNILEKRIVDPDTRWLMREIVESYETMDFTRERERERE